jgi:hypothetical protein
MEMQLNNDEQLLKRIELRFDRIFSIIQDIKEKEEPNITYDNTQSNL